MSASPGLWAQHAYASIDETASKERSIFAPFSPRPHIVFGLAIQIEKESVLD
jgi:hypothetical protein